LRLTGQPLVMGVLNLTPDSFSDGGLWVDRDRALAHALEMLEAGADLIDLGAESTRPGGGVYGAGAENVPTESELDRLLPVLEELRPLTDAALSVDTRKGSVAAAALAAGADLINDISACSDPELGAAVAAAGCPLILMHSRGELRDMQSRIRYDDLLAEVTGELEEAVERATAAGVDRRQLLVDPGIGFGKKVRQNVDLIGRLDRLRALDLPLVLGASRKSFIGDLTGATVGERLPGSLAAVAWALQLGASIVRVHDVAETVQFIQVWSAIQSRHGEAG
jgi:dihydropteroate synthase